MLPGSERLTKWLRLALACLALLVTGSPARAATFELNRPVAAATLRVARDAPRHSTARPIVRSPAQAVLGRRDVSRDDRLSLVPGLERIHGPEPQGQIFLRHHVLLR